MNKYLREIKPGVFVDVYQVLMAWDVRNPALQHLIKKALQAGNRGHKDLETDLQDIIDSAVRAKELEFAATRNQELDAFFNAAMTKVSSKLPRSI